MNTKTRCTFAFFVVFVLLVFSGNLSGQVPPPPPNGGPNNGHGLGGNQPAGGSAPIGGGIEILLALGAFYSGKKIYSYYQNRHE